MRRRVLAAFLLLGLAATVWWFAPGDPTPALRARWRPLARLERRPDPKAGPRIERWLMIRADGDSVTGLWRPAPPGTPVAWTAVLLGGLQTGARATLLLPEGSFNVLAVDWPWRGPTRLAAGALLLRLGTIREAVLRSPAALATGLEAVATQPEVDTSRVVLLGASLGVPSALAALRLPVGPDALVLLDGGADLALLLRAGLERERIPGGPARSLAAVAARLIAPLEPARNAPAAARLPVLVINSEDDERVPRAAAVRLHASLPGADIRWRPGRHVRPRRGPEITGLTAEVSAWLARLGERDSPASR